MDNKDSEMNFDKFMDDIVIRERRQRRIDEREETPQRKLAKMYRELPQNRITFRVNNNG